MRFALRFANWKLLTLASGLLLAPLAALAQYSQGPQPYNSEDPQNYGYPAAQSYGQDQDQGQGQYPADQRYDPSAYDREDAEYGQETISQPPPPLPDYEQPEAPGDGYIWTPGYWAFGRAGYYWVPGVWVEAPYRGALWTPGYWGYAPTGYFWNVGYWGPVVGFYGGINYGFGYFGSGFCGGYWLHDRFFYNREYARIGRFNHDFYDQREGGIIDRRPRGLSFTNNIPRGEEFRRASYNRGGTMQTGVYNRGGLSGGGIGRSGVDRGGMDRGGMARGGPDRGPSSIGNGVRQGYSSSGMPVVRGPQQTIARVPQWGGQTGNQIGAERGGAYTGPAYGGRGYGGPGYGGQPAGQAVSARPSAPQQSYHQMSPPQQSYHQQSAPMQSYHQSAPAGGGGVSHMGGGGSGWGGGGSHGGARH